MRISLSFHFHSSAFGDERTNSVHLINNDSNSGRIYENKGCGYGFAAARATCDICITGFKILSPLFININYSFLWNRNWIKLKTVSEFQRSFIKAPANDVVVLFIWPANVDLTSQPILSVSVHLIHTWIVGFLCAHISGEWVVRFVESTAMVRCTDTQLWKPHILKASHHWNASR